MKYFYYALLNALDLPVLFLNLYLYCNRMYPLIDEYVHLL